MAIYCLPRPCLIHYYDSMLLTLTIAWIVITDCLLAAHDSAWSNFKCECFSCALYPFLPSSVYQCVYCSINMLQMDPQLSDSSLEKTSLKDWPVEMRGNNWTSLSNYLLPWITSSVHARPLSAICLYPYNFNTSPKVNSCNSSTIILVCTLYSMINV